MNIAMPLGPAEFAEQYQEKKPLLMRNAVDAQAFTWRDANEIFERADAASENLKLSLNGIRPKHEYVEQFVDIGTVRHRLIRPVVYECLREGATLIANKIRNEPKVSGFARQIADFTGRQVVSSAYAAFGSKDSFRCHWDTRDVFAVQLIGRKRWILYPPSLQSPWFTQQSRDYESAYPCPSEPALDVILQAGDVLYVPRGWWHNPLPLGEETFHLALGTFPPYTMDYLNWAMSQMPADLGARQSLHNWQADQASLAGMGQRFSAFINDRENYQRFMDAFSGGIRSESAMAIELLGNAATHRLEGTTCLRLASIGTQCLDQRYLIANGTKINLDASGERLIRVIAEHPGIAVARLLERCADLDADALNALLVELCRQDVLELCSY